MKNNKTIKKILIGSGAIILLAGLILFALSFGKLSITEQDSPNSYLEFNCGNNNFYSIVRDACVEYPETDYFCVGKIDALVEVGSQSKCNAIGGVWDLCPQCPQGRICPSSVCEASCDIGQTCSYRSAVLDSCYSTDEKITRAGECVMDNEGFSAEPYERNNETYYRCSGDYVRFNRKCVPEIYLMICEEGYKYNIDNEMCETSATYGDFCSDGTLPEYDEITEKDLCINPIERAVEESPVLSRCPSGTYFNPEILACDEKLEIYNPINNTIVVEPIGEIIDIQIDLETENNNIISYGAILSGVVLLIGGLLL